MIEQFISLNNRYNEILSAELMMSRLLRQIQTADGKEYLNPLEDLRDEKSKVLVEMLDLLKEWDEPQGVIL